MCTPSAPTYFPLSRLEREEELRVYFSLSPGGLSLDQIFIPLSFSEKLFTHTDCVNAFLHSEPALP